MSMGRERFIMISTCLEIRQNELAHVTETRIRTYLQDTFETNIMFRHSVDNQSSWDGQAILGQM